jgi:hypothetical protein
MKKNAKIRLTLNRETLRNLAPEQMADAAGGGLSTTCTTITQTCFCLTNQTCPSRCDQDYCHPV